MVRPDLNIFEYLPNWSWVVSYLKLFESFRDLFEWFWLFRKNGHRSLSNFIPNFSIWISKKLHFHISHKKYSPLLKFWAAYTLCGWINWRKIRISYRWQKHIFLLLKIIKVLLADCYGNNFPLSVEYLRLRNVWVSQILSEVDI